MGLSELFQGCSNKTDTVITWQYCYDRSVSELFEKPCNESDVLVKLTKFVETKKKEILYLEKLLWTCLIGLLFVKAKPLSYKKNLKLK